MQDHEHPIPTRRSRYRYLFTSKHHGGGDQNAARWSLELSENEEFSVFDIADEHDLSDERHWLYGVFRKDNGELRDVGTVNQQMAAFPFTAEGQPWHGYPLWPIAEFAPGPLRGEKHRPPKEVFEKMVNVGLLTIRQKKRLWKGDHA